jgi:hypothetical protein
METAIVLTLTLAMAVSASAAIIPADKEFVQSLDGTWRFKLEQERGICMVNFIR